MGPITPDHRRAAPCRGVPPQPVIGALSTLDSTYDDDEAVVCTGPVHTTVYAIRVEHKISGPYAVGKTGR